MHVSPLLRGHDYSLLKPIKKRTRDSFVDSSCQQEEEVRAEAPQSPSQNVYLQQDGSANTNHLTDKNASLVWDVNLNDKEIREQLSKQPDGISIVSKGFVACKRVFHLKLDFCKKTN